MFYRLSEAIESIETEAGKAKEIRSLEILLKSYSEGVVLDTVNFLNQFGCPPHGKKQFYPLTYLVGNSYLLDSVVYEKSRSKKQSESDHKHPNYKLNNLDF